MEMSSMSIGSSMVQLANDPAIILQIKVHKSTDSFSHFWWLNWSRWIGASFAQRNGSATDNIDFDGIRNGCTRSVRDEHGEFWTVKCVCCCVNSASEWMGFGRIHIGTYEQQTPLAGYIYFFMRTMTFWAMMINCSWVLCQWQFWNHSLEMYALFGV